MGSQRRRTAFWRMWNDPLGPLCGWPLRQRGTPLQATPGDLSVEVNGSHARRWRSRAARYRPARSESLASTVRSLVSAAVLFAGAGKLAVTTPSTWALPLARIPLTALGIRVDGMPYTIRQVRQLLEAIEREPAFANDIGFSYVVPGS